MSVEAWNRLAPHFGPGEEGVEDNEELWPALRAELRRLLPAPARILDLGCGAGQLTAQLAADGFEVAGLDPAPEMVSLARKQETRATFREGGAESLAEGEVFDGVVSSMVFPFVARMEEEAERIHDHLAPGGVLVFSVFHPGFVSFQLALGSGFFRQESRGIEMPYEGESLPLQVRSAEGYEEILTSRGFVKLWATELAFSGDVQQARELGQPPVSRFLVLAFRRI